MVPNVRTPIHFRPNVIIYHQFEFSHRTGEIECDRANDSFDLAKIQWHLVLLKIHPCNLFDQRSMELWLECEKKIEITNWAMAPHRPHQLVA